MKTTELIQAAKISKKEKEIANKFGVEILIKGVTIHPVTCHGSGRWSRNYRSSTDHKRIDLLKSTNLFNYETGNNAPRGGTPGEYHKFTPKIRRLGLVRKLNELKEIEIKRIEACKKEEQRKFNEIVKSGNCEKAIEEWKKAVEKCGNPYWAAQNLSTESEILIQNLYNTSGMSWRQLFANI